MNRSVMDNFTHRITLQNTTMNSSLIASQNAQFLAVFIVVILTNFCGACLNILLLLAMIRSPQLRKSSSSALIMHCIIIDLYSTIVGIPASAITSQIGRDHRLPESACRYQTLYIYMPVSANMYAACVVALHRLIATILPRHFTLLTRKSAMIVMIVFPWIVAFTINIFPVLQIGIKMLPSPDGKSCSIVLINKSAVFLSTLFGYYIPTVLIGVSYVVVLGRTGYDAYRKRTSRSLRRRLEISRMLFVSFLWHCITVYPPAILLTVYLKEFAANYHLQLAIKWLSCSFSAVNPV